MHRTRTASWALALPLLVSAAVLAVGCGDDSDDPPAGGAGASGSAGSSAGTAGSAGSAAGTGGSAAGTGGSAAGTGGSAGAGGSAGTAGSGGAGAGGTAGAAGNAGAAGAATDPLCDGVPAPCEALPAGSEEAKVAEALKSAKTGTTVVLGEGTFALKTTLKVKGEKVTIRGQGVDKTVLDFKGQTEGDEGLRVDESPGLLIEDLQVRDAKGDGVGVFTSKGVTVRRVKVSSTGEEASAHGAYGIHVALCENVLVAECEVSGAASAGVNLDQVTNAIASKNDVQGNVVGIQVTNGIQADVTENTVTQNATGIAILGLPGLPQAGKDVRVFKNKILANNLPNFAPPGGLASYHAAGIGVEVMASRNVEVFDNDINDNQTTAFAVLSSLLYLGPIDDPSFYPWPRQVHGHDNRFQGNGKKPDSAAGLGVLLALEYPSPAVVPELVFDGADDPDATSALPGNPLEICFKNNQGEGPNQAATFVDLAYPDLGDKKSTDLTPYTCALPPVAAVTLPGN